MDRATPTGHRARRGTLLAASAIALVFAAAPERAAAQFAGVGDVKAGSAEIGTNTVDVFGPRTVIDWTPNDTSGPAVIDFLPSGATMAYRSNLTDYTVLNRILPTTTSMIGLNGTITSVVGDGSEGQIPGGNVWFYTPYGFVVGSGATINVGGLILTTNDIAYGLDGNNGAIFTDAKGAINFRGVAGSTAPIIIQSGASLIGNNASSYIAVVGPRIEQRGFVSADRSIAYVAGEQVDLTINAGQFDIVVGQGTTDANGVIHTGITTGSQSVSSFDGKTISFVAIPKNDALTMMLGGSIGYTQAASVFNDGSAIVLTAGDEASPAANIHIGAGEFLNRVVGNATGDLTVAPEPPGIDAEGPSQTTFRSFADLSGEQSVHVTAAGSTRIQADQSLTLFAGNEQTAGSISIEAYSGGFQRGTIAVAGELAAIADHRGGNRLVGDFGTDAQGGEIAVGAYGGNITAGSMYLSAQGNGGQGVIRGGNGRGGSIDLAAGFGGSIVSDFTQLNVTGDGGAGGGFVNDEPVSGQGGIGRGGSITVADSLGDRTEDPNGGLLDLGSLFLDASAVGGNPFDFGAGMGGDAFGGMIDVTLDRRNQAFSSLYAYARAQDGESALDPVGGDVTITIGGGISVDMAELYVDVSASAGVNGPEGAFARGGTIGLSVIEGAALRTQFNTELVARADTAFFFFDGLPDSTPDLTGGDVTITADGGTIEAGSLFVDVGAYNYGATTRAGFAHGGTATLTAANGGSLGTRVQDGEAIPQFSVKADAYRGAGIAVGESRGGDIALSALSGGTISAPFTYIELDAAGETGTVQTQETNGAPAFGGNIAIDAIGGAITAAIDAYAFGEGGSADLEAGSGTGGAIDVRVLEGGALGGGLFANAYGQGGHSFVSGSGGHGTGGTFSLLTDASASLPGFYLYFGGYGSGGSAADGQGGDGIGGSAQVDILGGNHDWSGAYIGIYAEGAASQGVGSVAGSARGSETPTQFHIGDGASLSMSSLTLDARATAYANGGSNEAVGGTVGLLVDGSAILETFGTSIDASATMAFDESEPSSIDTSPTARGGTASAIADGGTIRGFDLHVLANGQTAGAMTAAGSAHGGTAIAGAANGGLIEIVEGSEPVLQSSSEFASGLIVEAVGYGAEGPSAAHATGGNATLFANGGTVTSPAGVTIAADAAAGSFAGSFAFSEIPANGFDATGGTALVQMAAGTSGTGLIEVPSLTVSAQGFADSLSPIQGNGGVGTGGTATVEVGSGSLVVKFDLGVLANGFGGAADENFEGGTAFASGNGAGGTATVLLSGGSIIAPSLSIEAQGFGADGIGGSEGATPSLAGHGSGGSATLRASAGSLDVSGVESQFVLSANGYGGSGAFNPGAGAGGAGGFGTGGTAVFEAPTGSNATLSISSPIYVGADGFGGAGGGSVSGEFGPGGDAFGGSALMMLADIGFAFGDVGISASGFGGPSGLVFSDVSSDVPPGAIGSGTGHGGTAGFELVDSGPVTAARAIAQLHIAARGSDFSGLTVNGDGGTTSFVAEVAGPEAALAIAGDLLIDAGGIGAPDGSGFTGSIAGAAVEVGGTATIRTPRDAVLTITDPGALSVTGDLRIEVGRTFTSTGAIATLANASIVALGGIAMTDLSAGGTTLLSSTGGPVTISNNLLSGGLVTVLGRSIDIVSQGALSFADADATAGDLAIQTAGDLDLVTVDASGTVTLASTGGSIGATGAVNGTDLTFVAAGDVVSGAALYANGDLVVDAGGQLVVAGGSAGATGDVSLSADLGIDLASVVSGGTTFLRADLGAIAIDSLTSADAVDAAGRSVAIASPGALTFTGLQASAGDIAIQTADDLTLAGGSATGALILASTGGSVVSTGALASGGDSSIAGNTGVELGAVTSGGTTALASASGSVAVADLNSSGPVTASGRSVTIGSSGALTVASAQATAGDLALTTAQGLTLGTASATGTVNLTSGGALATTSTVSGADISLSGTTVTIGGAATSSGALALTAQQILTINALATGTAITATAGDITIGSGGRLGSRGLTRTLLLAATSTSAPLNFGGTGTATQFSIDTGEASRLFADERIALVSGSGNIRVGDLAMSFGTAPANIGSGGTLKIDTTGNVTVNGAVALTTSSAADTFSIDPLRIDVIAGAGSIAMLGASGSPLGTLVLEGGTIAVASQQTLDAIAAANDFAAVAALLDQPGPAGPAGGYLQAGTIDIAVRDALYIQNGGSGTGFDDRRGFAAEALTIVTGTEPIRISINGVILGPSGTVTGLAVANVVTIDGQAASAFGRLPVPTINGCAINIDCARPDFPGQSSSDLERPLSEGSRTEGSLEGVDGQAGALVQLADTEPLITPPLVDEPITGVGNDDLWQVDCEPDDDEAQCPAGDGEND
jgi:filamentous hemagglutinin family protein